MQNIDEEELLEFFKQRLTYRQISDVLKQRYPGVRGFSVASIKLHCKKKGLSSRLSGEFVASSVDDAVREVIWIYFCVIYVPSKIMVNKSNHSCHLRLVQHMVANF